MQQRPERGRAREYHWYAIPNNCMQLVFFACNIFHIMNSVIPHLPFSRVRIVADDLSGACDSAAAMAGGGVAEVWFEPVSRNDVAVLALDADTRGKSRAESAATVAAAFTALAGHDGGATLFFQKIDSTLRGHIGADLLAAKTALGLTAPVVICPAFPAQRRTLRDGRARLGGEALADTELWSTLGLDSDNLTVQLQGQGVSVGQLRLAQLRSGEAILPLLEQMAGVDAIVCDAETDADLALLAAAIAAQPKAWMVAGSAGLAAQLARYVAPSMLAEPAIAALHGRPWLTVIGSMSTQSSQQVAVLAQRALRVGCSAQFLLGAAESAEWLSRQQSLLQALKAGRDVVVHIDGPLVSSTEGQNLSNALARFVAPVAGAAGGLLLSGGESARATLDALHVTRLSQVRELMPGVSVARFSASWTGFEEMPLCIKAGAFGDDQVLSECLSRMRGQAAVLPAARPALPIDLKGTPCTARE